MFSFAGGNSLLRNRGRLSLGCSSHSLYDPWTVLGACTGAPGSCGLLGSRVQQGSEWAATSSWHLLPLSSPFPYLILFTTLSLGISSFLGAAAALRRVAASLENAVSSHWQGTGPSHLPGALRAHDLVSPFYLLALLLCGNIYRIVLHSVRCYIKQTTFSYCRNSGLWLCLCAL